MMKVYVAFLVLGLCVLLASAKPGGGRDKSGKHGKGDRQNEKRGERPGRPGRPDRPDRQGGRGGRGHEHRTEIVSPECEALTCERPSKESWVCGTDGMTYRSECLLMKDICKGRIAADVEVASQGLCEGPDGRPVKPGAGREGKRPGKDGKRPNGKKDRPGKGRLPKECLDACYDFIGSTMEPITAAEEGPVEVCTAACPVSTSENPQQQVCGNDARTYESQCVLELIACVTENTTLTVDSEGACQ